MFPVAVGARGPLPTWNGPCDEAGVGGDAVTVERGRYVAVREGDATLGCRDGLVRMEARAVASLRLEGPATLGDRWQTYRLTAAAADGGALNLGDAEISWTLSDSLERDSSCHGHLIASCDPPRALRVRLRQGAAAAEAEISATFGGRRATRTLRRE